MSKKFKVSGSVNGGQSGYLHRTILDGPELLETFIQQNRAYEPLEVLAEAAHPSRPSLRTLEETVLYALAHKENKTSNKWLSECDYRFLRSLARIEANQRLTPNSLYFAVGLFKAVLLLKGKTELHYRDRLTMLECLSELGFRGDFKKYERLLLLDRKMPDAMRLFRANMVNPFVSEGVIGDVETERIQAWLRVVNQMYGQAGLELLSLTVFDKPPFDNLVSDPLTYVNGPLVTVMVPTFQADERFDTMMKSLTSQSWRNLQIVVVDDCTPGGVPEVVKRWVGLDGRVEVLRTEVNGGTYPARNFVLERIAKGKFFTVHDDDDWSHPRKIETQVSHLMETGRVANMSMLVRATPELRFTRINNNPNPIQNNYSSLMFEIEPVREHLGFWGDVNRSGDAEFIDRMRTWLGREIDGVGGVPLSFLRVREGSLTSGEIGRGYVDTRRRFYQLASRSWHAESAKAGVQKPFYQPRSDRSFIPPFATPTTMRGSKAPDRIITDVIYATDFRFPGGNSTLSANEIVALLEAGIDVSLVQIDSPLLHFKLPIHPRILEISKDPRVKILSLEDKIAARAVIVRHPSVAEFLPPKRADIVTSGEVVLIANHPAVEPDGARSRYQPANCIKNLSSVFGKPVVIHPESRITAESLRGLVDPRFVTKAAWNGTLDPTIRFREREVDCSRNPIVGRHSRDNYLKWPNTEQKLFQAYPNDGIFDVRILGGAATPKKIVGSEKLRSWKIYEYMEIGVSEFLEQLDFWVFYHHPDWEESFGMSILEAMVAGLPVILPPYLKSTFKDAAIYTDFDGVKQTISNLWNDPESYRAASQRAHNFAMSTFGTSALLQRVNKLMGPVICRDSIDETV